MRAELFFFGAGADLPRRRLPSSLLTLYSATEDALVVGGLGASVVVVSTLGEVGGLGADDAAGRDAGREADAAGRAGAVAREGAEDREGALDREGAEARVVVPVTGGLGLVGLGLGTANFC